MKSRGAFFVKMVFERRFLRFLGVFSRVFQKTGVFCGIKYTFFAFLYISLCAIVGIGKYRLTASTVSLSDGTACVLVAMRLTTIQALLRGCLYGKRVCFAPDFSGVFFVSFVVFLLKIVYTVFRRG